MNRDSRVRSSWIVIAVTLLVPVTTRAAVETPVDFDRDVRPLFARSCLSCHGAEKQKGGIRLDERSSVFEGGDSGEPAVVPGKPGESVLFHRISTADDSERMPPKGDPLTRDEIALLERWIAAGAPWPESSDASRRGETPAEMVVTDADRNHWAFRPLRAVAPPGLASRTPIDAFLLAALKAKGLTPTPQADRRTLIRRVTFDLIGLPPTPEEVEAFEADDSPDAWERLVERLLASPQYGERWGRHWLDVARYADSEGYERDGDRPAAFSYRDFVIRAFNRDLPFDAFVRWQLAGDEETSGDPLSPTATGFLAVGPVVTSDTKLEEEVRRYRYDELDDILTTTGSALLGLTIGCARCHDHKYDPIPTRDYYRLLSAFTPTKRVQADVEPFGRALVVTDESNKPGPSWLLRRGEPMARGEEVTFGVLGVVLRGASADDYLYQARREHIGRAKVTTLRRSALAAWMTDLDHGAGSLVARVMVNRVWQHHFGEGLVRTPGDFGLRGDPPSHPKLLEWLAARFVADGWSVKALHRLILASDSYRQGTAFDPSMAAVDPENKLLWHRRPLRLEAEALRDTLLAVSGTLNVAQFGPGVKPPVPPETMAAYNTRDPYPRDARDDDRTRRRSVYLFIKRSLRNPLIETFDGADPSASCSRRLPTTVAPQALALLNDDLVRRRAHDFADRLAREAGDDLGRIVTRAYALALGRAPRDKERDASVAFLETQIGARRNRGQSVEKARSLAVADFGQALFGLNEFLYVD